MVTWPFQHNGMWCSGSTTAFDTVDTGSTPVIPVKRKSGLCIAVHFLISKQKPRKTGASLRVDAYFFVFSNCVRSLA